MRHQPRFGFNRGHCRKYGLDALEKFSGCFRGWVGINDGGHDLRAFVRKALLPLRFHLRIRLTAIPA